MHDKHASRGDAVQSLGLTSYRSARLPRGSLHSRNATLSIKWIPTQPRAAASRSIHACERVWRDTYSYQTANACADPSAGRRRNVLRSRVSRCRRRPDDYDDDDVDIIPRLVCRYGDDVRGLRSAGKIFIRPRWRGGDLSYPRRMCTDRFPTCISGSARGPFGIRRR